MDELNQTMTYAIGEGLHAAADTLFVTKSCHLEIQRKGKDLEHTGEELGVSFWLKHKGKPVIFKYKARTTESKEMCVWIVGELVITLRARE